MLVDTLASHPVTIVPEMNSSDLLERKAKSSEPGNGSEIPAII